MHVGPADVRGMRPALQGPIREDQTIHALEVVCVVGHQLQSTGQRNPRDQGVRMSDDGPCSPQVRLDLCLGDHVPVAMKER